MVASCYLDAGSTGLNSVFCPFGNVAGRRLGDLQIEKRLTGVRETWRWKLREWTALPALNYRAQQPMAPLEVPRSTSVSPRDSDSKNVTFLYLVYLGTALMRQAPRDDSLGVLMSLQQVGIEST